MARWQPDTRQRLEWAALQLFAKQGYEGTTAAQVAEAAGLTERTFYRHFADKREVLFPDANPMTDHVRTAVARAPERSTVLDLVRRAVDAAGEAVATRGDMARQRATIIERSPELRERELVKLTELAAGLRDTLIQRQVPAREAGLAAELSVAVFRDAFACWMAGERGQAIEPQIEQSFATLATLWHAATTTRGDDVLGQ